MKPVEEFMQTYSNSLNDKIVYEDLSDQYVVYFPLVKKSVWMDSTNWTCTHTSKKRTIPGKTTITLTGYGSQDIYAMLVREQSNYEAHRHIFNCYALAWLKLIQKGLLEVQDGK